MLNDKGRHMSTMIKKPILFAAIGLILCLSSPSFSSDCSQGNVGSSFSESSCTIPPNGSGESAVCTRPYSDGTTCGQLSCDVFIGVDYGDDVPLAYLYKNEGVVLPKSSKAKLGILITFKTGTKVLESEREQLIAKEDPSNVDNNQITWSASGIADVCNEQAAPPSTPENIQVKTGLQMFGQPPIAEGWAVAEFTWGNNPANTSYNVEYCTSDPCPSATWLKQSCSGSPCLIETLTPDVDYSFKVSASNSFGTAPASSTIEATTPLKANVYGLISGLAEGNSVTITALPGSITQNFTNSPISFDVPYGTTSLSVSGNGQTCSMSDLQIPKFAYHRKVPTSGYIVFERDVTCE